MAATTLLTRGYGRRWVFLLNFDDRRAGGSWRAAGVRGARLALLLLPALVACAPENGPPPQPPTLVFGSTTAPVGTVDQGTPLRHRFVFHNAGGSALAIDNIKATCDCTAVADPPAAVAPGASGAIDVHCATERAHGPFRSSITVYSNDPARQVVTLTLAADVTPDIVADPPSLYVGHLRRGETSKNESHLYTGAAVALHVDGDGLPVVQASLQPAPAPPAAQDLAVAIRPDAPLGRFSESVRVLSTSPRHPVVTIAVVGFVDGDLVVNPRELSFGQVAQGEATERTLLVENQGQGVAHVTGARVSGDWGRAEVEAIEDGRKYRVRIALNAALPPGRFDGRVAVRTDNPEQPVLRVPVSGQVRKREP